MEKGPPQQSPNKPLKIEKKTFFGTRHVYDKLALNRAFNDWKNTFVETLVENDDPLVIQKLAENRKKREESFERLFETGDVEIWIKMLVPGLEGDVLGVIGKSKPTLEEEEKIMKALEFASEDKVVRKKMVEFFRHFGIEQHHRSLRGSYPWFEKIYKEEMSR